MTAIYKKEPVSNVSSLEEVLAYVQRELTAVEAAMQLMQLREIETLHVAPQRVKEGLTVLADGTDWNPGGGQGVYTYYAAAWHKLG